ncbi:hypothetical protein [Halovenus salina]|uniref:Uncharacterized protein n=1 Tax=Halovenus salina TaxID=1510225 RepID=A0ABD5W8Y9_9EURY|nr:hypothetical protein [Halovenus salina]
MSLVAGCSGPAHTGEVIRKILDERSERLAVGRVDVVRELQFPNGAPVDESDCCDLRTFLAVASSVGSRYGAYSGYRVLHESRPEKREQLLSEPNVDPMDPEGTLLGPWVLTGEGVADLEETLSQSSADLELQDNGDNFAPFVLTGSVVDGNRRRAVAEAVTRILSFKDGLRPERQAISVVAGLSSDIVAATEAVAALGGEDEPREMDMQDVQYGLSQLSWRRILPGLGGEVVSKVVAALLDAQERLSKAEVAELAGCSTRSLSTAANEQRFAELESAGLLVREDRGSGKATLWRLCLPFRTERHDDELLPRMLVDQETTATGGEWHLSNAVTEVLLTSADEYGVEYGFEFGGAVARAAFWGPPPIERDLGPLTRQYPTVEPVVSLLAVLLDQEDRHRRDDSSSVEFGVHPDPPQTTLSTAVG